MSSFSVWESNTKNDRLEIIPGGKYSEKYKGAHLIYLRQEFAGLQCTPPTNSTLGK